jgi:hypothetical protein
MVLVSKQWQFALILLLSRTSNARHNDKKVQNNPSHFGQSFLAVAKKLIMVGMERRHAQRLLEQKKREAASKVFTSKYQLLFIRCLFI